MHCENCGATVGAGARFCRECGHPVANETAEGPTGVSPTTVAPPPEGGATAAAPVGARARPPWLIPALAGSVLVIALVVAIGIVLLSGGESAPEPALLADQAAALIAPVSVRTEQLADALEATNSPAALEKVALEAERLATAAEGARTKAAALELRDEDANADLLLQRALAAVADYANATANAAENPNAATTGQAADAADEARAALAALAAVAPTLELPRGSLFGAVDQIEHVVSRAEAAKQQAAASKARLRTYVAQIDRLLTNSAETRGNLGKLVTGVQAGTITLGEARSQIAAILNQRQSLQNAVAAVDTPPQFARVAELLLSSIAASIDDDIAIQGWIDAWYEGDSYTFNRFWNEHLEATNRATQAKRAFVEAYNEARRKLLGMGPLAVGDRY
jgi:hypothetical protein